MKNILFLTQVLPFPPDSGPKVKTWNVIKYLGQHHNLTLVSFVRGDQSDDIDHLRKYCREIFTVPMERGAVADGWAMIKSMLTGKPWMIVRDERATMLKLTDRLVRENHYDMVHADQLNMAQFALRLPVEFKVLDEHNALWLLYKRLADTIGAGPKKWLLNRDWRLLKNYEGQTCLKFDAVLSVSQEDKQALEEAIGKEFNIQVIPIAIDLDEVVPIKRQEDSNHILHIGTMFWPPNIDGILWFLREVYPLIKARRPDVCVDIIGARPPKEMLDMAGNGTGINVTGYVEDPIDYIQKAAVMMVPLRAGGGMRVKILNALAQELPIVSTTLGCEGISVENGKHLLIADTPESFAEATINLLDDLEFGLALGRNGRKLMELEYDYRIACSQLDQIYGVGINNEVNAL